MKSIYYPVLFVILISITGAFRLLTLTENEVQPWDESMYALRAISVVENGNIIDQTEDAPGGLYSSSHPPLFIWLTSATIYLLGNNEFSIRIWSTIFYLLLILTVYKLLPNKIEGLLSAFMISTTPFLFHFAGLGQLDVCYVFFVTASLLFWKNSQDRLDKKYIYFSGILFGLAMMSKIIVGMFIPISIGTYLIMTSFMNKKFNKEQWKDFEILLLIGIVIALPWHSFMYMEYGMDFINYYAGFHLISRYFEGVESNQSSLGPLFYINQIIVCCSVVVVFAVIEMKKVLRDKDSMVYLIMFSVPFLIFTFSSTQLVSYTLAMIPGITLLAGHNLSKIIKNKSRMGKLRIISIILIILWSSSQIFRNAIKSFFMNFTIPSFELMILFALLISLVAIIISLKKTLNYKIVLLLSGLFLIIRFFTTDYSGIFKTDIRIISKEFKKGRMEKVLYIEGKTSSVVMNPQIGYYFQEAEKGIKQFEPEDLSILSEPTNIKSIIILNTTKKSKKINNTIQILNSSFQFIGKDSTYNYYIN